MKCIDFLFDCDNLLYCKCHKINLNCCRSYVDSLDSMKNIKRLTINPVNEDEKGF